jgi:hypothetical protein
VRYVVLLRFSRSHFGDEWGFVNVRERAGVDEVVAKRQVGQEWHNGENQVLFLDSNIPFNLYREPIESAAQISEVVILIVLG